MTNPLAKLDAATKESDVKELSADLLRKLKVLVNEAFDTARSDSANDPDVVLKTINAFTNLRGKLAPPATNASTYPTLNFAFVVSQDKAQVKPLELVDEVKPVPATPITFSDDDE